MKRSRSLAPESTNRMTVQRQLFDEIKMLDRNLFRSSQQPTVLRVIVGSSFNIKNC